MQNRPFRSLNDPARIAEYEKVRRQLLETEEGRKLLDAYDRFVAMLESMMAELLEHRAKAKKAEAGA